MGITVTAPNNGSDYVEFKNQAGTSLAKVGGYDDGTSNGHLEIYTTAAGTPTERVRIDSSGNVGIGTSSPTQKLSVNGALNNLTSSFGDIIELNNLQTGNRYSLIDFHGDDTYTDYALRIGRNNGGPNTASIFQSRGTGSLNIWCMDAGRLSFGTNSAERMGIDSGGNILFNTTVVTNAYNGDAASYNPTGSGLNLSRSTTGSINQITFSNPNGQVGFINTTGTGTQYGTSSDYRLKENIQPMQNALGVVAQLNPVTYIWKADGSDGQGFIAHELQAVVPDCVTGEKDAVDAEGNPVYQGIDTSFLVATLTKAIQEQQAQIETLTAKVAALEAK